MLLCELEITSLLLLVVGVLSLGLVLAPPVLTDLLSALSLQLGLNLQRVVDLGLSKQRLFGAVAQREDDGGLLGLRARGTVVEADLVIPAGLEGEGQGESSERLVLGQTGDDGGQI